MTVHFSTTCQTNAKRFLDQEAYHYLSKEAKEYILQNLGDIRVQDPMMYPKPSLEIVNNMAHRDKIVELC